jgi:hypothetical protein
MNAINQIVALNNITILGKRHKKHIAAKRYNAMNMLLNECGGGTNVINKYGNTVDDAIASVRN